MIFVILGSQKFQFNRLLQEIDRLVKEKIITEKITAQIGASDYIPQNFTSQKFYDRERFKEEVAEADIIITHGGTGAIIGALKEGKKVIALPRLAKYGEHVDNHQVELLNQFTDLNLICVPEDVSKLEQALKTVRKINYSSYQSNTDKFIVNIDNFIKGQNFE
ncbi:MAG: beta(1,3)galactosyltransferase EpsH [Streptococcaceae bacterium]|jgi:UDP-N-acetylglucosamine transferase subunit ALG13|nr:beta(1,3)galactosyltransferase EpsH [Streptococcaceae bacterium]